LALADRLERLLERLAGWCRSPEAVAETPDLERDLRRSPEAGGDEHHTTEEHEGTRRTAAGTAEAVSAACAISRTAAITAAACATPESAAGKRQNEIPSARVVR
jgi:hypothetical protein